MKKRETAALFAFLLGGLGVHKFYLNQIALGIVYVIFCWTFIPAIIALIEGIVLLTMSDQEFNAKYNISENGQGYSTMQTVGGQNANAVVQELLNKSTFYYNSGDYEASVSILKRVAALQPYNNLTYYNIACMYSLTKDSGNCLRSLQTAIGYGYSNFPKLSVDKDLEWMRKQPEYELFVKNGYQLISDIAEHSVNNKNLDLEQIEKLSILKEKGVLSEEEFIEQKKRLLNK